MIIKEVKPKDANGYLIISLEEGGKEYIVTCLLKSSVQFILSHPKIDNRGLISRIEKGVAKLIADLA